MRVNKNKSIVISGTEVVTSKIGFGTSGIMGAALTDRGRLKLLNSVYDLGVLHFDTAPLYGMGEAENLIGKFVRDKRDSVTIATKYGLNPKFVPWYYRVGAPVARAVYHRNKWVKGIIHSLLFAGKDAVSKPVQTEGSTVASSPPANSSKYTHADMKRKLDASLKKLSIDYIDIYLLHDCSIDEVTHEVIDSLNSFVQQGKIKSYGFATARETCKAILTRFPGLNAVVQVPQTIFDDDLHDAELANNSLKITHSALNLTIGMLREHLSDPIIRDRWYSQLDCDVAQPVQLANFLLSHARSSNKQGIVLFSSTKPKHIKQNLGILNESSLSPSQVDRFVSLARQELVSYR